jgi:hypothetical protein
MYKEDCRAKLEMRSIIFDDLPQYPRVHERAIEEGSLGFSGTEVVGTDHSTLSEWVRDDGDL